MTWRVLRPVLAVLAIAILFHLASPAAVIAAFARADLGWILLTFVLHALSTGAGTVSFAAILAARGVPAGFLQVLTTDLAGHFYALTLPAGIATGAAIRVVRLAGDRAPVATLLGAILASRLLDLAVCTLVTLASLPFFASRLGDAAWFWALLVGGLAASALTGYTAAQSRRLRLLIAVRVLPLVPGPLSFRRRLRRTLRRLGGSGRRPSVHLLPIVCVLSRHLLGGAALVAMAHGFGTEVSYSVALWVRGLTTVAVLLPLSVFGLGIQEASFVFLLAPFGVSAADALAMSLLVLAYHLCLAGAGGVAELAGSLRGLRPATTSAAPARRPPPSG